MVQVVVYTAEQDTTDGALVIRVYTGLDLVAFLVVEEQTVQLSLVEKLQDQQLTLLYVQFQEDYQQL